MPKKVKNTRAAQDRRFEEAKPASVTFADFFPSSSSGRCANVQTHNSSPVKTEYTQQGDSREIPALDLETVEQPTATSGPNYTIKRTKKGKVPISYENRNKGKKVTIISNVSGDGFELLAELKKALGCGGNFRETQIELQGDRQAFLETYFRKHPCLR